MHRRTRSLKSVWSWSIASQVLRLTARV